jgi:hypothetical protein
MVTTGPQSSQQGSLAYLVWRPWVLGGAGQASSGQAETWCLKRKCNASANAHLLPEQRGLGGFRRVWEGLEEKGRPWARTPPNRLRRRASRHGSFKFPSAWQSAPPFYPADRVRPSGLSSLGKGGNCSKRASPGTLQLCHRFFDAFSICPRKYLVFCGTAVIKAHSCLEFGAGDYIDPCSPGRWSLIIAFTRCLWPTSR